MMFSRAGARVLSAVLVAIAAGCLEAPPDATGVPPLDPPSEDGDGPTGVTCEEAFGSAPEYLLCTSTATTCTFYTRLLDGVEFTCADACAEFGVPCLDGLADDDDADDKCTIDEDEDCEQLHEDQICVCALPPG